ncbi:hypothetical protein Adt_04424 [Abeliophyllum distichum]|uniref:Uncharacterized protein n=1 Tax=Abeliophyllum distichum TaxID=126358 RepID=A0ABD1W1E2_9LAMI
MSRPPLRPEIPPRNSFASTAQLQTSSSQNIPYYQERIRFDSQELICFPSTSSANQSSPQNVDSQASLHSKGKEILQDRQDPEDDVISINKLLSQIQEFQKTSKNNEGTSRRKKKIIKKKKKSNDTKEKLDDTINKALERILARKEDSKEKEIQEYSQSNKMPEPENSSQGTNDDNRDDEQDGCNNSGSGMSFSSTTEHNLNT